MRFTKRLALSLLVCAAFSPPPATAHVFRSSPITSTGGTKGVWIGSADFNHDGRQDVVVVEETGTVQTLLGSSTGRFVPGVTTPVSGVLLSGAIGDFNRDGNLDVAVLIEDPPSIAVLAGSRNGAFQSPVFSSLPLGPDCFAAADFDGDGIPDLIVADPTGLSFLKGIGNGQFATAVREEVNGLSGSHTMLAVDLNHDNRIDLVLGNNGHVLLGRGNGRFDDAPDSAEPPFAASRIAAGDLNADGDTDLVFTDALFSSVDIALGRGDGSFGSLTSHAVGARPTDVAISDVTGDGVLDIIASSSDDRLVSVLNGRADGSFATARSYASPGPNRVVTGDFKGGGHIDIAALLSAPGDSRTTEVELLPSTGGGNFDADRAYLLDYSVPGYSIALGTGPSVVGDFNGDGHPDFAVAFHRPESGTTIAIFLNRGDGTFGEPNYLTGSVRWSSIVGLVSADFNRDGFADLAVSVDSVGTVILLSSHDGSFSEKMTIGISGTSETGDLDQDGVPDLVIGTDIFQGMGDGTFVARAVAGNPYVSVGGFRLVDLNGDGKLDLVGITTSGSIPVFMNFMAGGNWYLPGSFFMPAISLYTQIAVADFDGDGIPDLVLQGSDGLVYFQPGMGDGIFGSTQVTSTNFNFGASRTALDYDGDGRNDLLFPDRILLGDGQLSFQSIDTSEPSTPDSLNQYSGVDLPVADFDGDSLVELVAVEGSTIRIVKPGRPATAGPLISKIQATASSEAANFGDPRPISFNVSADAQSVPTGGIVTRAGGKNLAVLDLATTANQLAIFPDGGTSEADLTYGGDQFNSAAQTTVGFPTTGKAPTQVFLGLGSGGFTGEPEVLGCNITAQQGVFNRIAGGTVTFRDEGNIVETLPAGRAVGTQVILTAGPHQFSVEYSGDQDFASGSEEALPFVAVDSGVSPHTSTLTVTPEVIAANSPARALISMTTRDASGSSLDLSGLLIVEFHTTLGTISDFNQEVGGLYQATLTSKTPGIAVISATVDGTLIDATVSVTFVAGSHRPRAISR